MNEKIMEKNEFEIDLRRLFQALLKHSWVIIVASVIGAILSLVSTVLFVTPMYQSTAMFYVNNNSVSVSDPSLSMSSGDLSTSRNLVNSYIVILKTRESLNEVIEYAGVDRTYGEVLQMISAEAINKTEVFKVTVTSPDAQEAEKIANAVADTLPARISNIIDGTSAKVVSNAIVAGKPSSPSYSNNVLIGFMAGFLLSVAVIVLLDIFNITIRTEEDIARCCSYPVLAAVPDMAVASKGGYSYSYDNKTQSKKKSSGAGTKKAPVLIGGGMNFAASEAYKLLRTKLQFAFTDEKSSRVIGVSSALSGEGKSLSAINLAYALSQLDKKVLVIDCDMRRPTMAEKLNVRKKPGLSSLLTGQIDIDGAVQQCGIAGEENAFDVIAAGQCPPNPIELLSSVKMERVLKTLQEQYGYQYIILDLPPVGEVSDAMAIAQQTDGILLVVRQKYCDRQVLGDTVRQFEFVGAKLLGVVYNCTMDSGKGYYKKYYNKYGSNAYAVSSGKGQLRSSVTETEEKV